MKKSIFFCTLVSVIVLLFGFLNADFFPDSLVSCWKFDEDTGTTVYDDCLTGNDGNIYNGTLPGATWTDGFIKKGLAFDGVNDYVEIPDDVSLHNADQTLMMWIKLDSLGGHFWGESQEGLSSDNESGGVTGWGAVRYSFYGGTRIIQTGLPYIAANIWYHLTFARTGGADGTAKIYINGVERTSGSYTNLDTDNPEPLTIGGYPRTLSHMNGIVDEVAIFNRELTADEIELIYRKQLYYPEIDPSSVLAWGVNFRGQLGDNTVDHNASPVQVVDSDLVGELTDIVAIAGGGYHSLALNVESNILAWGSNEYGQLGNGTTAFINAVPIQVMDPGDPGSPFTDIWAISGGMYHSLALKFDNTVWAWGRNYFGQLGNNSTINSNIPVPVIDSDLDGELTDVVAIAGGGDHNLALKSDGTVWTWGANKNGQLGNGTLTDSSSPVQVMDSNLVDMLTDVVAIAGGRNHSLALKSNGTVWAWGENFVGQLGNGTEINSSFPVQVINSDFEGALTNVVAISGGGTHSMALKSDGTVWAWGSGRLGDGNIEGSTTPVQVIDGNLVDMLDDVVGIASGHSYKLALKADGTVWIWGGMSGTHTVNFYLSNTPVQVTNLNGPTSTLAAVAGGRFHCLAIEAVTPSGDTPEGNGIVVQPEDANTGTSPVTLTFANVTESGVTSLSTSEEGPTPLGGFQLGDPPIYYDISTSAVFSGAIEICIDFSDMTFTLPPTALYHYENGGWVEVPGTINGNVICGTVTSLSPFAIFQPMSISLEEFITLVEYSDIDNRIRNSLLKKLQNALKSLEKGNVTAAANQIKAFQNEVLAQQGKKIRDDLAEDWIRISKFILDNL